MKYKFSEESFKNLLKRYVNGSTSPEENRLVDNWLNEIGKDKEVFLSETEEHRLEHRVWENIAGSTFEKTRRGRTGNKKQINMWIPVSVAASIMFILSFFYLSPNGFRIEAEQVNGTELSRIENSGNTVRTFILKDQTQVKLYPGSTLAVNRVDMESTRKVILKGKAYFHVSRDESKPFIVYAGDITTTVLGTSFTVNASETDPDIQVSVETGKVSVSNEPASIKKNAARKEVILVANQQAVFNHRNGDLQASIVANPVPIIAKAMNEVEYNEEPVISILKNLQNLYGVQIRYDEKKLAKCKITTRFDDEGLFDRLNVISNAIGGTYNVDETTIVFKNPGCK